ncbi:DUF2634 domain-containing protein [Brevibacillus gelatini]|uniref:DUF2634 domain-containing protein n=1 Tax=Brevibacillus gelatini TaxID=1655277 RepID=UPI003D816B57
MFPQLQGTEESLLPSKADVPIPWTYRFDWETKQLMQGPDGRYVRTKTYEEYLQEAVQKILRTRRFRYAIYSERYGVDFLAEKGRMRSGLSLSVIKAQAEEALEAHSEIERAQVQDIRFQGDRVVMHLEIEGVRGTTRMEVDAWKR